MIGWEVTVRRHDPRPRRGSDEWRSGYPALAGWRGVAHPAWFETMIADGTAKCVETHGGYPDVYQAPAAKVLPYLLEVENVDWDFRDEGAIEECPEDEVLEFRVWDQS